MGSIQELPVRGKIVSRKLTSEQAMSFVEESVIHSDFDLGHSSIYDLDHPANGRCILVQSVVGDSAVFSI